MGSPHYEPGMFGVFTGLAEVDVSGGELTMLLGNQVDEHSIQIKGLLPTQTDSFFAFVATSTTPFLSEPSQPEPHFTLQQIDRDGRMTPLRSDSHSLWGNPLWAPDASGAVIPGADGSTPPQTLVWVPLGDEPTTTFATGELFSEVRWAR